MVSFKHFHKHNFKNHELQNGNHFYVFKSNQDFSGQEIKLFPLLNLRSSIFVDIVHWILETDQQ